MLEHEYFSFIKLFDSDIFSKFLISYTHVMVIVVSEPQFKKYCSEYVVDKKMKIGDD